MSPSRFSAGITSGSPLERDEQRERRVDQLRLVRDVRVALGRRVHLLLEHPLVGRADGVLRPAEDLRAGALGEAERELGDRSGRCAARCARCGTRPRRRPRPRATPSRRRRRRPPCARPRSARGRRRSGTTPGMRRPVRTITWPPISSRRMPVRRADVVRALGRDRRRLQAEPVPRGSPRRPRGRRRSASPAVTRARGRSAGTRARRRSRPARARAAPPRAAPARSRPPRARRSSSRPSAPILRIRTARGWLHRAGDGATRRMATARVAAAVPVRGLARQADHGRGRDSSGSRRCVIPPAWKRRLDLAARRARSCRRPASTSAGRRQYLYHPEYPRAAGAGEVRQARALRRAAARAAEGDGRAPRRGSRSTANGRARGGGAADQLGLVPRRRRPVREGVTGPSGSRRCTKRHVTRPRQHAITFRFRGEAQACWCRTASSTQSWRTR